MGSPLNRNDRRKILGIVAAYAIFTCLWICAADLLLFEIVRNPLYSLQLTLAKDIIFCIITVILLYSFVSNQLTYSRQAEVLLRQSKDDLESHVTALEESRAALHDAHLKLAIVADSVPGFITHVDHNQRFLYVNRNYANWIGLSASEIIGKTVREIIGEEIYAGTVSSIEQVLKGSFVSMERTATINGEERVQYISFVPQFNEQGAVGAYFALISDITEIKTVEHELYASERKFRGLLENISLISVILDRNKNITFCNDYLLHLTGYSREQIHQRNWFDLFVPSSEQQNFKAILDATGFVIQSEIPIQTNSGGVRHIAWNTAPLFDSSDAVTGVALIGVDVTDRRKMEEQLRQTNKMEAIGTLAAGVAHDFNNLMTIIMGCAEMLQTMKDNDPSSVAKYADQIIDCVNRGSGLTRSLLSFSRSHLVEFKPVDLNCQLRKIHQLITRIIGDDIAVEIDCCDTLLYVVADPGQLDQVLMNMVSNARDAMPNGGRLKISSYCVERDKPFTEIPAGITSPGDCRHYAVIEITDSGIGMTDETIAHIFDPFFTTKEIGKGTGLGLSMAFGIIAGHHGFIDVESEPGNGTSFKIHIPHICMTAEKKMEHHQGISAGNETLLLVEDDNEMRNILKNILERQGYQVIAACDGEEGVSLFCENRSTVCLILSDVIMPKKNGPEMIKEINALVASTVPTIFMSGYASHYQEQLIDHDPLLLFLPKPVKLPVLLSKIRELIAAAAIVRCPAKPENHENHFSYQGI